MFNLFKSQEEKEIELQVQMFMQRLAAIGNTIGGDVINYTYIFNLSQEEIIGRINFAFYQVQILRLLSIVDLKSNNRYSEKFGAILGKAMNADKQIGYGAFQDLCLFIAPQNRIKIGVVDMRSAVTHWILIKIFEIKNPNSLQIKNIKKLIFLANNIVDEQMESISSRFSLSVAELAALNAS